MTISNYKPIGKGALVAAFDLDTPMGFRFPSLLLMEKGDRKWISFPGIPFEKDGKKGYKNVVEIPDNDRRNKFNDAVLTALRDGGHIQ